MKNMRLNFQSWKIALIPIVVVAGLLIRYFRMVSEKVWNDEVFYLLVSKENSFIDLIKTNHWIVDHPPLYLTFMHFWSQVSTSPLWIRLPNLLFYLFSAYFVYLIGDRLFRSRLPKVLLSLVYATYPYFVSLEWQAIPYALTMWFFLASFYYLLRVFDVTSSNRNVLYCAIYLSLFFLTSFESVYYLISLFLYNIIIFSRTSSVLRGRFFKMYLLVFVFSLPELLILLSKFQLFAKLSTHWLVWMWGWEEFILEVLGIGHVLIFSFICIPPLLFCIWKMLRDKSVQGITSLLLTILIGFAGLLSFVSSVFFYAYHPKAYYYVVFFIWLMALLIYEWGIVKYGRKAINVLLLMSLSSIFWFYPVKNWIRAEYMYTTDMISPVTIRNATTKLLSEDSAYVLVTDEEMQGEKWLGAYYLNKYYLECMDLAETSECQIIGESRRSKDQILAKKNQKILGVIFEPISRKHFEKGLCVFQEQCLLWDIESNEFRQIN